MSLITLEEAQSLLLSDVRSMGSEPVAIANALGRTLAEPVTAVHTQPAEPRSIMDGIAVPAGECAIGTSWRLAGEVSAGGALISNLANGTCVRIATGGVVPDGAVRIIPQELVEFLGNHARLAALPGGNTFIRAAGADFVRGELLIPQGARLTPGMVGLAAAANVASLSAVQPPRIAICTAGDELVTPGSPLAEGQSVESASHAIAALVRRWGGDPSVNAILPDDPDAIETVLRANLASNDVVVCVGGASVGKRDFMRPAAASLGAQILFTQIAVQPGKPCWHARTGSGGLILGLPGNPSSAFVCAHLLLLPLIDAIMGRPASSALQQAIAATPIPTNGPREQYLRAAASRDGEGRLLAHVTEDQDSGLQAALARSDLLIRRLAGAAPLEAGDRIEVLQL